MMKESSLTKLTGKFLQAVAGPAVKEIGEMLRDELRPYRAKRQKQLLEKTARMLQEAKAEVNQVPPKVFMKILDEGGLEDDETLHGLWATLLANSAAYPEAIIPAFVDILGQLSTNDALILE